MLRSACTWQLIPFGTKSFEKGMLTSGPIQLYKLTGGHCRRRIARGAPPLAGVTGG
jgi:hypothetical protein